MRNCLLTTSSKIFIKTCEALFYNKKHFLVNEKRYSSLEKKTLECHIDHLSYQEILNLGQTKRIEMEVPLMILYHTSTDSISITVK